ncbi:MAG: DUF4350 domain-containing protein, partial [Candidatus Thorarchaeota archaeon]
SVGLAQTTTILIDESHLPRFTSDKELGDFSTDMTAQGYSVEISDTWNAAQIMSTDVLVISTPTVTYSIDEFHDIHAFVAKGGGLFIIGDNEGFTEADELASDFGVVFSTDELHDLDDGLYDYDLATKKEWWIRWNGVGNFGNHPITQGVANVTTYFGAGLVRFPLEATPILMMDADDQSQYSGGGLASGVPSIVAIEYERGLGRIVVTGDANQFCGDDYDFDGTTSYLEADNAILARNIVSWLADPIIPDQIVVFDESHAALHSISSFETTIDVVFDESSSPQHMIGSGYADWAGQLGGAGFNVVAMPTFDMPTLGANDVIVLSNPSTAYSAGNADFILDMVRQGRGLLLLGDAITFLGAGTTQIAGLCDVEFYDGGVNDTDEYYNTGAQVRLDGANLGSHPSLNGVHEVSYLFGTGFKELPDNADFVLVTDSDATAGWSDLPGPGLPTGDPSPEGVPLGIAFDYGEGRVMMIGESDIFYNSWVSRGNNSLFGINLIRWLAGGRMELMYYYAARVLEDAGYGVVSMLDFDEEFLEDTDALVLCAPGTPYAAAEKLVMKNYVETQGNGLFLIGEYTILGDVTIDVASDFGFAFDTGGWQLFDDDDYADIAGTGRFTLDATNIESHEITSGVGELLWRKGNGLIRVPAAANVLLKMDDDLFSEWENGTAAAAVPMMAALEYGRGRVITIGDSNLWDEDVLDNAANGDDTTRDIDNYDNKRLLTNTLDWITANRAPTVELLTPNGGELVNGTYIVTWTTDDFDGDTLASTLYVSANNGTNWHLIGSAGGNTSFVWDTTTMPNSAEYLIRVEVSDGDIIARDASDAVFEISNELTIPWWLLPAVAGGAFAVIVIGALVMRFKKTPPKKTPKKKSSTKKK